MVKVSTYTFLKKVTAAMVLSMSVWASSFCMGGVYYYQDNYDLRNEPFEYGLKPEDFEDEYKRLLDNDYTVQERESSSAEVVPFSTKSAWSPQYLEAILGTPVETSSADMSNNGLSASEDLSENEDDSSASAASSYACFL